MNFFQGYVVSVILTVVLFTIYLLSQAISKTSMERYTLTQKPAKTETDWAWWTEIVTHEPPCTYYFGPFTSSGEAKQAQPGYIEDLKQEGAEGIEAQVKWCRPSQLTLLEEQEGFA